MACEPENAVRPGVVLRRAIDLALDGQVSVDDAAAHLCRLANYERASLDAALQQLQATAGASARHECARASVCRAVDLLTAPRPADARS